MLHSPDEGLGNDECGVDEARVRHTLSLFLFLYRCLAFDHDERALIGDEAQYGRVLFRRWARLWSKREGGQMQGRRVGSWE